MADNKKPKLRDGADPGRYRRISTRIWNDHRFRELGHPPAHPSYLVFFLLTNPATTGMPGLYRARELALAEDLGWTPKSFREAFTKAQQQGFVEADWKAGVVWVPNAVKHDPPASANVVKSWGKIVRNEIPECPLLRESLLTIRGHLSRLFERPEPFLEAFDEAFDEAFLEGLPKGFQKGFREGLPKGLPEPGSLIPDAGSLIPDAGVEKPPTSPQGFPTGRRNFVCEYTEPTAPPEEWQNADFFAWFQFMRQEAGFPGEPEPRSLGADMNAAMMAVNGDIEQLMQAVENFGADKFWQKRRLPWAGLVSQLHKYLPRRDVNVDAQA